MEFKPRISYRLASSLVMVLFLVAFEIFEAHNIPGSWSVLFMLIPLFLVIRLLFYSKYIYMVFSKKPALVVTENYIYDAVNDIRFNRDEIDTLYDDNGYLRVKLIGHEENSHDTYVAPAVYKIDLELIDISYDKLVAVISDFNKREQTNQANADTASEIVYQFKWGRRALWFVFQFVVWCAIYLLQKRTLHQNGYFFAVFVLILLSLIALAKTVKFVYFWIAHKPVLTANRSFIFDQFQNIKYYWNDVDEIVITGEYMVVTLYHPEKYLDEIKNPVQRFFKKWRYERFRKKPSYSINLDIVGVKADEYNSFLNTLNEFSIIAEG